MASIVKVVDMYSQANGPRANASYGDLSNTPPWLFTTANYAGTAVAVYLEVDLATSAGTSYINLSTAANSAVTGSEISTTATTPTRVRSGDLYSQLVNGTDYKIRCKTSSGSDTATLYAARLIIIVSGSVTAHETDFSFGSSATTTSTSYVDDAAKTRYLYTAANWDGTMSVYWEAHMSPSVSGNTCSAQLVRSDGTAVSSSEITLTGTTTDTRVRSAAITLADGETYRIQLKASAGTARVRSARLILVQSGTITKTETYYQINTFQVSTPTTQLAQESDVFWDVHEWDVDSLTTYHEAVLSRSSGTGTIYCDLHGTTDLDTQTHNSITVTRKRSASISLTDDTPYDTEIRADASTTCVCYGSLILVVVTYTGVSNNVPVASLTTADGAVLRRNSILLAGIGTDADGDAVTHNVQITANPNDFDEGPETTQTMGTTDTGFGVHPEAYPLGGSPDITFEGYRQIDDRCMQSFLGSGGTVVSFVWKFQAYNFNPAATDGSYRVLLYEGSVGVNSRGSTVWTASQTVAQGALRYATGLSNAVQQFIYTCIVAGVCGGSEPAWTEVEGDIITDGADVRWRANRGLAPIAYADYLDTPTRNWVASSGLTAYAPGVADHTEKTVTLTTPYQTIYGEVYWVTLDWIPNSASDENTISIDLERNGTDTDMPAYLDGRLQANNGPRVADTFYLKVNESFVVYDVQSDVDAGFSNTTTPADTDPFTEGETVVFNATTLDLAIGAYMTRRRVIDPDGSNTFSAWTTGRDFTVSNYSALPSTGRRAPKFVRQRF